MATYRAVLLTRRTTVVAFVIACAIVADMIVNYDVGRAILGRSQLRPWQAALELTLGAVIVVGLWSRSRRSAS